MSAGTLHFRTDPDAENYLASIWVDIEESLDFLVNHGCMRNAAFRRLEILSRYSAFPSCLQRQIAEERAARGEIRQSGDIICRDCNRTESVAGLLLAGATLCLAPGGIDVIGYSEAADPWISEVILYPTAEDTRHLCAIADLLTQAGIEATAEAIRGGRA